MIKTLKRWARWFCGNWWSPVFCNRTGNWGCWHPSLTHPRMNSVQYPYHTKLEAQMECDVRNYSQTVPPVCPHCGKGDNPFMVRVKEVKQVFLGETMTVDSPVTVCRRCGFEILIEGQLDELTKRTYKARVRSIAKGFKAR